MNLLQPQLSDNTANLTAVTAEFNWTASTGLSCDKLHFN